MTKITVTATGKVKDTGDELERSVEYDFGDNLDEMVDKFGEDVVFSNAKGAMVISLQSIMRTSISKNESAADCAKKAAEWKPKTAAPKKSKVERGLELTAGMSKDDLEAFLKSAQKQLGKAA